MAYATIISQFLSAALVLAVLTMDDGGYRLVWKDLSVDKKTLKQILSIGLPAGLQQSLTSFSNVYVQSYINYFAPPAWPDGAVIRRSTSLSSCRSRA